MSSNKEDTLRQFCDVTGADETRSKFFLESSNWQLEVALSSFYEHGGNIEDSPAVSGLSAAPHPTLSDSDMESPPTSPNKSKKQDKKKTNTRFATLDTLQQQTSSDEEEGQAFYAGGSERSGQQILGPGKGRKDIVTEMFKSVRERGAVVFEDDHHNTTGGRGSGRVFGGVGYRLGQTVDDHEQMTPCNRHSEEQSRSVRLRLYREGFTVDNGPVRLYSDPSNAEFLGCIRRGEVPAELSSSGGEVRVSLEDHRHEQPSCARTPRTPFTGAGHLLGSPTPVQCASEEASKLAVSANASETGTDVEENLRVAQAEVKVDDSQPTTTIQFRLADGRRVSGRFNHCHTVGALQQFVARAQNVPTDSFALLTAFPARPLADPAATLAQADLLATTLLQRPK